MPKRAIALTAAVVGLLIYLPSLAAPKAATTRPSATTKPAGPALPKVATTSSEPVVKLTPQQEAELLAAMKRSSPDHYYPHLMAAKKGDPNAYQRSLSWMWRKYVRWRNAPKEIQEQMLAEEKAIREIGELVQAIGRAKDAVTRDRLRVHLIDAVTRKFDAGSGLRNYRLEQFEQRLQKIRKDLDKRKADRDKIIKEEYELWIKRSQEAPPAKKKSP